MEKITKGAVKNGESRRRDVGGMRGESKFFCGICCRCSSLRMGASLWGWIWTSHNKNETNKKADVFGWRSYFDWGHTAPRIAERICEDEMNPNCLCVGSRHYHWMRSAVMSRDFCRLLIHNFSVMRSVCHACLLIGNVK